MPAPLCRAVVFPNTTARHRGGLFGGRHHGCGTARWKHGVSVTLFPHTNAVPIQDLHGDPHGQETCDALEERLADDTQTPVPDQAVFRIDFPQWLRTLSLRERKMVKAMMRDERTNDLSRTFGVSAGRISQIRGDLKKSWTGFCGEGA
jgi:hypothetical protein